MKYEVAYTELSQDDTRAIRAWLSQFYPGTPRKFFAELKKRIVALEETPYMYPEYEDRPPYRRMVVSDYLVFYKVNEEKKRVEIHRILHAARDIRRYLP